MGVTFTGNGPYRSEVPAVSSRSLDANSLFEIAETAVTTGTRMYVNSLARYVYFGRRIDIKGDTFAKRERTFQGALSDQLHLWIFIRGILVLSHYPNEANQSKFLSIETGKNVFRP